MLCFSRRMMRRLSLSPIRWFPQLQLLHLHRLQALLLAVIHRVQVPAAYPEVLLSLDGRIESDSKTLNIDMEDIFIDVDGSSGNLSFAYVLSSFDKSFDIGSPVMILELDLSVLMALAADLSSKFIPYEDLIDEMI